LHFLLLIYLVVVGGSDSSTEPPGEEATTVTSRTVLEDFPSCGEKGTSTRVVGGTEVVMNEYPWLCSLKYKVLLRIHPIITLQYQVSMSRGSRMC
jgi:hypothetical protein